jgi:hypothetical protein
MAELQESVGDSNDYSGTGSPSRTSHMVFRHLQNGGVEAYGRDSQGDRTWEEYEEALN